MPAEFIRIHKDNPQERLIARVVECLRRDGVIIYPTDTVYGLGCDIHSKKAIEKLCRIKGIRPDNAKLSCVCEDLKIIGEYALHVTTPMYKMLKRALPGPYTFILQASKKIPKHFQSRQKTVGIRIPDHHVPIEIVRMLGNPIVTTSLHAEDDFVGYDTDPEIIFDRYEKLVDMVIDSGTGTNVPSTIIDCSEGEDNIEVLREGAGSLDILD
jgi:tRNA threonylcarbamoyl adenosine modification protein (Sua5/YciO/YrdC/YwlC family)